ncbi:MAG: ATP-binding protein, partial [Proteobacteria bacterium]|nr:ATP-binding protein [Pseudomonadota bacterium]
MTRLRRRAASPRSPITTAAVFLLLLAGISGPLLIVTWYELFTLPVERADAYHAELRALAHVVAEGLADPLWNLTPDAGAALAGAVFENDAISAIEITSDLRGPIYRRQSTGFDAEDDWQVTEEILYDGQVIGAVTLWHASSLEPFAGAGRATHMVVVGIVQLAFGIAIVIFVLRVAQQSERNRVLKESHKDLSDHLTEVASSRRQFQLVTDSLPVRILRLDPQQVIRFVNMPAAHDQQREPREMVGRPLSEFYAPDTVAAMQPHIRRALDGDHHESDWVARPKAADEEEKTYRDEWIPERDETGKVSGLFWLSTDVTDERRRVRDERQSNQLASLGQLTGGIAHDFNNLLLVVRGNLELLGDDVADRPELLDLLSRAQGAVERGARLTRQLLAFASNQVLAPVWVNVNDMLREFQELLSRTLGDNVAVELDLAEGLPNVRVDRAQLEAAIVNLALNARDAMPVGGRLTLTTELQQTQVATRQGEPQDEYVVVEATDTGEGMTPEVMERVFEPFYTTKDVGKGTGLGLSMVYGFVRQSNGAVTVKSEPGVGTTFRIFLP